MNRSPRRVSREPAAEDDLAVVKRIILSRLGDRRARVFLFGSRARGDHRPASDIDLALLPQDPLPRGLVAEIREALEESPVPFFVDLVDLVDLSEASPGLCERVLREGIEWTASSCD